MTQRAAKSIAWSAPILFGLSMIFPPGWLKDMHQVYGFQLAWLSFWGAAHGFPLCILGFAANVSFLLALLLLIIRVARGRPWPAFGFIACVAMLTAIAMAISRTWLTWGDEGQLLSFGFLFWFGSAIALGIGTWGLRFESKVSEGHGFEVIFIATVAAPEEDDSRNLSR